MSCSSRPSTPGRTACGPPRAPDARGPRARGSSRRLRRRRTSGSCPPSTRTPRRAARDRPGSAGARAAGPSRDRARCPAEREATRTSGGAGAPCSRQASRSAARTASAVSGSPSSRRRPSLWCGSAEERRGGARSRLGRRLRASDPVELRRRLRAAPRRHRGRVMVEHDSVRTQPIGHRDRHVSDRRPPGGRPSPSPPARRARGRAGGR